MACHRVLLQQWENRFTEIYRFSSLSSSGHSCTGVYCLFSRIALTVCLCWLVQSFSKVRASSKPSCPYCLLVSSVLVSTWSHGTAPQQTLWKNERISEAWKADFLALDLSIWSGHSCHVHLFLVQSETMSKEFFRLLLLSYVDPVNIQQCHRDLLQEWEDISWATCFVTDLLETLQEFLHEL